MGQFANYRETRQLLELAARCEANHVNLLPLVEQLNELMERTDLSDDEIYNEFLGRMALGAANLAGQGAGYVRRGLGAMGNSFMQGYRMRAGQNQPKQTNDPTTAQRQDAAGGMPHATSSSTTFTNTAASQSQSHQHILLLRQMISKIGQDFNQVIQYVNHLADNPTN